MARSTPAWFLATVLALGCNAAAVNPKAEPPGPGGSVGGTGGVIAPPPIGTPPIGPAAPAPPVCPNNKCTDFPKDPILDEGVPADAANQFGAAPAGAPPCVWEPEDRTMFPQKWLRPRIRWTGTTGLHRITISSEMQANDLVVYTTKNVWTMPRAMWTALAMHVVEKDIVIKVRAASGGEVSLKFQIAPVTATGSMVFWAVKPEEVGRGLAPTGDTYQSELRGFAIGDETTVSVLKTTQVMQQSAQENGARRPVRCIGCHAAVPAPDNSFVAFVDDWPWNLAIAGVKPDVAGQPLPGLQAGGQALLNLPWSGMMTFSKPHWKPGKRMVVVASSLQNYAAQWGTMAKLKAKLVWYNLDAPAVEMPMLDPNVPASRVMQGLNYGEVMRQGDPNGAAAPTWSNDGATIVYSSTAGGNADGALQTGATDLYRVPFNDGAGGPATPVMGASDPAFEEYYASYAPDDQLLVYTRVPRGQRMYSNKLAELAVVPAQGGTPARLAANDPPECTGKKSPGINNHWAKWSSSVPNAGGKSYYWLLFSSNRADIPPAPRKYHDPAQTGEQLIHVSQLYMTLVVKEGAKLDTYPAVYLWNQPQTTLNTTPIWEDIVIPPTPPVD